VPLLWVTEEMSMLLVEMEKSEEELERLKFQMDVWMLMSVGLEISSDVSMLNWVEDLESSFIHVIMY